MAIDYKKINKKSRIDLSSIREQRGDKTHFIYELIQNADDSKSKRLELHLCEKELLVWNDGYKFREEDVLRISSIGFSDKDLTQIGNFGTGFKAVYNYTDRPEVYSGDERFCLPDPTGVSKTLADLASSSLIEGIDKVPPRIAELVEEGRTVFRLPFKENLRPEDLMLLKGQLRKLLKKRSLLFLPHLETIQWYDICDEQTGTYCRYPYGRIQSADQVELKASMSGKDPEFERFLVFSKKVQPRRDVIDELLQMKHDEKRQERIQETAEKPQPIEIAFKLQDGRITAMNNCVLFAYLPTEKETRLRFFIQARYQTNPARNDIEKTEQNPWNRWLVEETAKFLPEVLEELKEAGLLEPTFFNVLPLDGEVENDFKSIADALRDAMKNRSLVPTQDGGYAKAENVFYPESTRLRKLVKSSGMHSDSNLLHPYIRKDTKESGRCFDVMAEAGVEEIDESDMLYWLEKQSCKWFKNKTNKWLCSLYIYFNRKWSKSELERIKELPLVRLENREHVCVSDQLVYFPPETDEDLEDIKPLLNDLRILKSTLLRKEGYNDIKAFLRDIGVKKLNPEDLITESICPLYSQPNKLLILKNRRHVRYIFKSWQKVEGFERNRLEESVGEVPILRVYKGIQREASDFVVPCDAYLPQAYTGDNDLETYFSVSDGAPWFVDDKYLTKNSDTKTWLQFLKAIGAMDTPIVTKKKIPYNRGNYQEFVKELDNRDLKWKRTTRWWKTSIEDLYLLGLPEVLNKIGKQGEVSFSQVLWRLLVKMVTPLPSEEWRRNTLFNEKFKGTYNRFRYNPIPESFDATFYRQLKSTAWIPGKQGKFHVPSVCFLPTDDNREVLGDNVPYLPSDFDISTRPARWLAKKLDVRLEADADNVLNYLQTLSQPKTSTETSIEKVERIYKFLESKDADLWRFEEEPLIFTPEPEPRWWRTDEVFWEDESDIFGDDRGYLKVHYSEDLKSFFTTSLEIPKHADTLAYVRCIQDITSKAQAGTKGIRDRVQELYRCLWRSLQENGDSLEDEEWQEEWEQLREEACWLGRKGDEWGFFSPQKLVWNDHPYLARIFEGKVPFWEFTDELLELATDSGIEGCSQARGKFVPSGDQENDEIWSRKVQDLRSCIHAFLKSSHLCDRSVDEKSLEVLSQLSVRRVEKLEVTYELNDTPIIDREARQCFLDKTNQGGMFWLALEAKEDEYAELIGDASQDYFGVKELRGFVEDLLTKDRSRVLTRWERDGLRVDLCESTPEMDCKESEEIPSESVDEEVPDETGNADDSGTDDSEVETPAVHEEPETGNKNDDSTENKSETASYQPRLGGSGTRPRGGKAINTPNRSRDTGHSSGLSGGREDDTHMDETDTSPHDRKEIERIGMEHARRYEEERGHTVEDVSAENLGFDLRSTTPNGEIRCIEVKARSERTFVLLTPNEWRTAKQLKDDYFLYIVLNAGTQPQLYIIPNPADTISEMKQVAYHQVPLSEIEEHGILV